MPRLVDVAIDVMGNAYPDVAKNREFVVNVIGKEEERFRHTLKNGLSILDGELDGDTHPSMRCRARPPSCSTTRTASRSN